MSNFFTTSWVNIFCHRCMLIFTCGNLGCPWLHAMAKKRALGIHTRRCNLASTKVPLLAPKSLFFPSFLLVLLLAFLFCFFFFSQEHEKRETNSTDVFFCFLQFLSFLVFFKLIKIMQWPFIMDMWRLKDKCKITWTRFLLPLCVCSCVWWCV